MLHNAASALFETLNSNIQVHWASLVAQTVKHLPARWESWVQSGRSPGGGHGNPLQYSCLENPMARGSWWATVHGAAKGQTQLSY